MRLMQLAVCAGITLGWILSCAAAAARPPAIPVCANPPQWDGNLDDPAWRDALAVTKFVVLGAEGFPACGDVTARIMRDDAWLFIGFDIRHPEPGGIEPKARQRDDRVQGENCVKVAFDPGTDGKIWYHIRLSAGNVVADQRNDGKGGNARWNIPLRSATRISATGWQAELKLPLSWLIKDGDPAKARMNLLVHLFVPVRDANAVVVGETRIVAAWAPTAPDWWNTPERFMPVAGLAGAVIKEPFLPVLEEAQVGGYQFDGGASRYDVSGRIRNYSGQAGQVCLRVRDIPDTGSPGEAEAALELRGDADAEFTISVPVAAIMRRNIHVNLETAAGDPCGSIIIVEPPELDCFKAYLDRNYYTAEPEAGVVCRIGLPESALEGTYLLARMTNGAVLARTQTVSPRMEWQVPLREVAAGRHELRLELSHAGGTLVADQTVALIKRAPHPGREWKIDQKRRMLLDNGAPFFVYGILTGIIDDENIREIAAAGFNSIMLWGIPDYSPAGVRAALDLAAKYDLRVFIKAEGFASTSAGFTPVLPEGIDRWPGFTGIKGGFVLRWKDRFTREDRNRIYADFFEQAEPFLRAGIAAVKDHPALMGYESFDEPLTDLWFDQYIQGRALYRLICETDGYHPVRTLWNAGLPPYTVKYTDWSDFHARNPYWAPPVRQPAQARGRWRRSPNEVAREAADLTARGRIDRKPTWLTPVYEVTSSTYKRLVLPEEQRAQTYLALLYETSGIFYFGYPAVHQATWEMLRQLGGELRILKPVLATPVPEQRIVYQDREVDVIKGKMPDVHAALRRNPAGGYALLAVNSQPWSVRAAFHLPFADHAEVVRSPFGPETYALADGVVTDTLEPYARRVFLVAAAPGAGTEVLEVAVKQQALNADYVPEPEIERGGRANRRNILPNPSFEEAALPDFPDYWMVMAHHRPQLPPERTGRERALYALDADQAFHGRRSLRITAFNRSSLIGFPLAPQHDQPADYVWSAWIRAAKDGQQVVFNGTGMSAATMTLTTEWRRYHVRLKLPARMSQYSMFWCGVVPRPDDDAPARVWVDAMQVEQGVVPGEFEP